MADTFFKYFVQDETHDLCWEWEGRIDPAGYGRWGQTALAHRESARRFLPEFMDSLKVLHRCDNRKCVRPSHLYVGTQLENIEDRDLKGRTAKGESIATSKLTEAEVKEIRALWKSGNIKKADLAKMYGVAQPTILQIVLRRTWKHIKE